MIHNNKRELNRVTYNKINHQKVWWSSNLVQHLIHIIICMIRGSNKDVKHVKQVPMNIIESIESICMYCTYTYIHSTDDRRSSRYPTRHSCAIHNKIQNSHDPLNFRQPVRQPSKSCCWVACACVISITTCIPPTPCLSAKNRPHRLQPPRHPTTPLTLWQATTSN